MQILGSIGTVIVTFFPDREKLCCLIERLISQSDYIVIADNGETAWIDDVIVERAWECVNRQDMCGNMGIGAALNTACRFLETKDVGWIATFDQDSLPPEGMLNALRSEATAVGKKTGRAVAAIGPIIMDSRGVPVISHDFFQFSSITFSRISCQNCIDSLEVGHLITSGCLFAASAWQQVKFDESLFIDIVDVDWCWRVKAMGYSIIGSCSNAMQHELSLEAHSSKMGLRVNKYSPIRRYYFSRNCVHLIVRGQHSFAQKRYLVRGLLSTFYSAMVNDTSRWKSLFFIIRGCADGFQNRLGVWK